MRRRLRGKRGLRVEDARDFAQQAVLQTDLVIERACLLESAHKASGGDLEKLGRDGDCCPFRGHRPSQNMSGASRLRLFDRRDACFPGVGRRQDHPFAPDERTLLDLFSQMVDEPQPEAQSRRRPRTAGSTPYLSPSLLRRLTSPAVARRAAMPVILREPPLRSESRTASVAAQPLHLLPAESVRPVKDEGSAESLDPIAGRAKDESCSGSGGDFRRSSSGVPEWKGTCPVTISYSTTPNE